MEITGYQEFAAVWTWLVSILTRYLSKLSIKKTHWRIHLATIFRIKFRLVWVDQSKVHQRVIILCSSLQTSEVWHWIPSIIFIIIYPEPKNTPDVSVLDPPWWYSMKNQEAEQRSQDHPHDELDHFQVTAKNMIRILRNLLSFLNPIKSCNIWVAIKRD